MCCRYLGVTQDVTKGNNPQSPISKGWINSKQWVPCIWGQFGYLLFVNQGSAVQVLGCKVLRPPKAKIKYQCNSSAGRGTWEPWWKFPPSQSGTHPPRPSYGSHHARQLKFSMPSDYIIHQHPCLNKEKPLSMPPHCKMHYRAQSSSFESHTTPVA